MTLVRKVKSNWHVFPACKNWLNLSCRVHGFRILTTGFLIFFSGPWIPDSNCYWDSGFLQLYSGFQGSGFRIPQAKFSKIPDSTGKNFRDSGIRIPLHGRILKSIYFIEFSFFIDVKACRVQKITNQVKDFSI